MNAQPTPAEAATGIPAGVFCAQDYEALAAKALAGATMAYIAGGAGRDQTLDANRAAFGQWSIWPRLLRDVGAGHTRLSLGGPALAHPLLLAPVAFQTLVHPRGEIETARAAHATETCMLASTLSSFRLEDIASAGGPTRWFQLYFQPSRDATLALVRRAEAAGYGALVVTLDAPIQPASLRALRAGFRMPADCVPANLAGLPAAPATAEPGDSRIFQGMMRTAPGWDDFDWLRAQTRLPVWVKGVMHPDDAAQFVQRGAAGLVVSNHGGRSLDGAPASLRALPAVRARVGKGTPVLFDGGIRCGEDVFKAMALGADAVLIGRLQVYALAVAGALGVAHMLKLLREELEACMALAGCATLADIGPDCLLPKPANAESPQRAADADLH
ncbi:alpha-hydroxy acid oxidase [Variovorax dokdonensis]|uniref:Alpha-hydroxy acid oxidase n=1 Tax=Variovorax dokdonensis TaxID=344883 RepID=A0ABT7NDI9_9BURK|nr:alpha-hydroxy acid oxidase [Variovorax dokdonensis]MDM0045998.1 alpha-hydroxy acid oxidase [Variovorax dokdonensis]